MPVVATATGSKRNITARPDYFDLAVRYLARADKTVVQVEQYVLGKGASRPQVRAVVHELERRGYLNDQAYYGYYNCNVPCPAFGFEKAV